MGKNELGQVVDMAGRSYLFFLSFGQSHFKHSKDILIELRSCKEERLPLTKYIKHVGTVDLIYYFGVPARFFTSVRGQTMYRIFLVIICISALGCLSKRTDEDSSDRETDSLEKKRGTSELGTDSFEKGGITSFKKCISDYSLFLLG